MITIIKKLLRATLYSLQGLRSTYKSELAFRLECWLSVVLVPIALLCGKTPVEKSILLIVWLLVLIMELVNSAIESVVNRIGPEHNLLSGRAKDMGAAAVLVALILACFTWIFLLS
jgi:diacylglycerol kinase (ATP)